MVEPVNNISQAAYKTGEQEEAELRTSDHMVVSNNTAPELLSQSVWTRSIDMLMGDLPAERPEYSEHRGPGSFRDRGFGSEPRGLLRIH